MSQPEAEVQLQRVLAMVPWLAANPGVHKDAVAKRFQVSPAQLEKDLALIMMVGVPPYSPGDYIDVDYEGDTVDLRLADYFERPLRLSPGEGLALLAAGNALLAVDGSDPNGPLAHALQKLEGALDVGAVTVQVGTPEHLGAVRAAAEAGETIEIDYWSGGRDELSTRRIDPGPVFFALGEWYTDARCHLRDGPRMFRIDRIRDVRTTALRFEPATDRGTSDVYQPQDSDPSVALALPADASWVAERFPVESVEDLPEGGQRVVLRVSQPVWLERVLLRAGPEARVLEPDDQRGVGAAAANRVLARYQPS